MTLPDCMVGPNEPCEGFGELHDKVERLRAELADVQQYRQAESANVRKLRATLEDAVEYYEHKLKTPDETGQIGSDEWAKELLVESRAALEETK